MRKTNYASRDRNGRATFYVLLQKRCGISLELFDTYWKDVHGIDIEAGGVHYDRNRTFFRSEEDFPDAVRLGRDGYVSDASAFAEVSGSS